MVATYAICERTDFQVEQNKFDFRHITIYKLELFMDHTLNGDFQKRDESVNSVETAIRRIVTDTVRNGIEVPTMLVEMQKKHDLELDQLRQDF